MNDTNQHKMQIDNKIIINSKVSFFAIMKLIGIRKQGLSYWPWNLRWNTLPLWGLVVFLFRNEDNPTYPAYLTGRLIRSAHLKSFKNDKAQLASELLIHGAWGRSSRGCGDGRGGRPKAWAHENRLRVLADLGSHSKEGNWMVLLIFYIGKTWILVICNIHATATHRIRSEED